MKLGDLIKLKAEFVEGFHETWDFASDTGLITRAVDTLSHHRLIETTGTFGRTWHSQPAIFFVLWANGTETVPTNSFLEMFEVVQ